MQDEEYMQAEEAIHDQDADTEKLQKEREYQERWDKLTLTSDFIFGKVMQDRTICKLIIEILLGVKIAKLTYLEEQKIMDVTLDAKGVRLDVYLEGDGRIYNVEMQVADEKNLAKRSRYYQAMIDINTLSKGKKYQKLKESFVIFICAFDPHLAKTYHAIHSKTDATRKTNLPCKMARKSFFSMQPRVNLQIVNCCVSSCNI